ncbi:MAG: PEP-CTERM sorting domain-containing protein [Planctomycetota bacterium]
MLTKRNQTALCTVLLTCFAATAFGHGGGGDIAVFSANGKVEIGFATLDSNDAEQETFDPNDIVHQAVLTPLSNQPPFIPWEIGSTEPGFDANENELPALAAISYNVVSIKHWDGVGTPVFTPTSDVTGGYAPQPDQADSLGGYHRHPTFGFSDLTKGSQPIANGVYLTELTISVDGLEDSDPFYLVALVDEVVNSQADPVAAAEELGQATRDYLADPSAGEPMLDGKSYTFYADAITFVEALAVPEPSTAMLVFLAVGAAVTRRR